MTENELVHSIEESKTTVLRAIQKNLPEDLFSFVEDVTQETYLRYYLAFKEKPPLAGESLHKWLYVVARNECRRAWRDNKKTGSLPFQISDDLTGIESLYSFPTVEIDHENRDKWVRAQINELPEPFRQTTLYRLAGHKVNKIAQQLGVSAGTVKSRLARGREMLARLMNKNQKEQELDL
ncbi:RNA polymerase sigma factor [Leptospira ilyithenensis]|uniref:Sigma-70 family RNA polymerase sigma factor n=1 Tax=Leptospira ilyithenensis TaxID=2484901 RepID=A0A4R9LIS0_9LEPT|nr:sigma-70 family RNA polymerase sigma factor [Leptospira ilyithenensis]TGN06546.1 sigma-70 family RNA polymerase sigma factor [Leptospira ilyithenensis]